MSPKGPSSPRRRRSTDEVRRRILEAAAFLFSKQGFDGTTTREIAARAGVVEPLVYRHFGSKARLLEAVIVEPLSVFVEDFETRWRAELRAHRKLEARVRDFVGRLYDLLSTNREVVVNILQTRDQADLGTGLAAPLDRLFETMADISRFGGYDGDADAQVRLTFGLITSAVILDRWLWRSVQPSRDEIVDALTAYMLPMFLHPAASEPGRPRP